MFYRERALWLPGFPVLTIQFCVSIKSYCTLWLFKKRENGIKEFFRNNYRNNPDPLVFDGSSNGYYDRIERITHIDLMKDSDVIDLGCGRASFLRWLQEKTIAFKSYVGIDFAINEGINTGCPRATLISDNVLNVKQYIHDSNTYIIMCNLLCYLSDCDFEDILSSLSTGNKLIIIDPSPGLFWDAHFNGIKPSYRGLGTVIQILENIGYCIESSSQDYLFSVGRKYFVPLSFGIVATKSD